MKFPSIDYKSALKLLLKIFFAFAIIYWLISQNKLDYRLVLQSFKNPLIWIVCCLMMALQILLSAIRWRIILLTEIKEISIYEVLRIQWIGQFFSVILPGAVTGDLVKIGYISSLKKNVSKKFLLLSIFIDRLAGLNSLLILAGFSSIIFYKDLVALNPLLKGVIYVNIIFLLGSFGILLLFFLNKSSQTKIKNIIPSTKINGLLNTIWAFSDHKKQIQKAILISALGHIVAIAIFWLINIPFFEKPIELKYLLSLIPLGQVAVALPISPAGLGVGHAAFDRLFHFIGHTNGASLFNVYWVVLFAVSFSGIFPFLLSRESASSKVLQEQEQFQK